MTGLPPSFEAVRALAVLRSPTAADAIATAAGYLAGGLTVIELTYSTRGVLDAVRELSARPGVTVGVGTVMTPGQAESAIEAGAQFVVSPVLHPWLPELVAGTPVAAIPGAATPTEIWRATDAGVDAVKVFPIARLGGAAYIRDLLAPMPGLRLIGTGGVDLELARDLLAAGCLAVGVGTVSVGAASDRLPPADRAEAFLSAISSGAD